MSKRKSLSEVGQQEWLRQGRARAEQACIPTTHEACAAGAERKCHECAKLLNTLFLCERELVAKQHAVDIAREAVAEAHQPQCTCGQLPGNFWNAQDFVCAKHPPPVPGTPSDASECTAYQHTLFEEDAQLPACTCRNCR
jgi:hypothetical protein